MNDVAHTFSIVGRDEAGLLGVAVSSCVPAVGALCPFVRAQEAAIASQAYLHPYLALDLFDRLRDGAGLAKAAEGALAADPGREWRQLLAIAPTGDPIVHTGAETDPWAGHRRGADCAAAGNLLVGEDTVLAMVEAFEASAAESLPTRLIGALEAAQAAGGDRRGRQSAAVLVKATQEMPFVDLRVDDHTDPVAELRRIWTLLSEAELERNMRVATTREPRPLEDVRARQEQVRQTLAEQGR